MKRRLFICLFLSVIILLSICAGKESSSEAANKMPHPDVLILHDSVPGPLPPGLLDGNNVLDLLGHFGLKGAIEGIEQYKANDLSRYRFIIMLAVDPRKSTLPTALISDVRKTSIPVFWVGNHLPELTSDPQFTSKIGFRVSGPGITEGFNTVLYKGVSLTKNDPAISPIEVLDRTKAQIMATAQNAKGTSLPYIIHSGDFWYCADSPFGFASESDRYLAFCDILHDFFKMQHSEERNALVRLEDISVEQDPDELRKVADYLHDKDIPFQIALIPIFVNPEDKSEIYLSDRPEFVHAIQYMVSKGGSVVMHGVTHRYRGKSGDDFEFWDEFPDRPVPADSRSLVENKLRLGLEECFRNGIYPLTWETPHYAGSKLDYSIISEYFNSSYERVLSLDRGESGHFFPYTSVDRFNRFIIPENLGYIAEEKPDPDEIVKNAERLRVVRDGVASFFFHPFLNIDYLKACVDGIEKLGYKFISIKEYDLHVQMDSRLIQTYTDSVHLPMKGLYLHRFFLDDDGHHSREIYSQRPQEGIVTDPGIVDPNMVLVMEGVQEVSPQSEQESPSIWAKIQAWVKKQFSPSKTAVDRALTQPQAIILWDNTATSGDANDQQSFYSAFSTFGFTITTSEWKKFSKASASFSTVLAIPVATANKLSAKQNEAIVDFVRGGGRVVLDGECKLSELLGIRSEKRSIKVHDVQSEAMWVSTKIKPEDFKWRRPLIWNPPATVSRFTARNSIAIAAEDKESELPLAVLTQMGQGRILYLGARLDPITPYGYARFPYFMHWVLEGFDLRLPLMKPQLELYFDPGDRSGVDIERLAADWRMRGVRAIYAAAYHFWPTWSYDYSRLVDVCHKNGILVYAWIELPHVSVKFWDDHPNWRAKTATGEDGRVGWRYHMDLDIPECQDAAFDFVEDLLNQYQWDGVNIAELNYDTNNGPEDPKKYMPMGKTTRDAFKALGGFDPILLFSPDSPYYWRQNPKAIKRFEDYRAQRVLTWHRSLLERLAPIAQRKDMELIVTMLDSLHSSTVMRDTGVDSNLIIPLMNQFPITLQVEDPAHYWAQSPDRYREFAKTYNKLVPDKTRLMFDVNIVDRELRNSHAPSLRAMGIEFARLLIEASKASGRIGVYSESTISQEDLLTFSRVLAHDARIESHWKSWTTQADGTIAVTAPGEWRDFKVDGTLWPGWGEHEVLLPKGAHSLTPVERRFRLFDSSILDIRLVRFTGDLDSLTRTDRGFQFAYDSAAPVMAMFNKHPFSILVDGNASAAPLYTHAGLWSVRLPRGKHTTEILADSTAIVILEKTSFYGSTLIVVFGAVACGLMLLIYFAILARRAVGRAVSGKKPTVDSQP